MEKKQIFFDAQLHDEAVEAVSGILEEQFNRSARTSVGESVVVEQGISVEEFEEEIGKILSKIFDEDEDSPADVLSDIRRRVYASRSSVERNDFNDVTGLSDGEAKVPDGGRAVQIVSMNDPDFNALVRLNSLMALRQYIHTLWEEHNQAHQQRFDEEAPSEIQRVFVDADEGIRAYITEEQEKYSNKSFDDFEEGLHYHIG